MEIPERISKPRESIVKLENSRRGRERSSAISARAIEPRISSAPDDKSDDRCSYAIRPTGRRGDRCTRRSGSAQRGGGVAEGVETADQLQFLRTLGCDEYQGYHKSHPLTAAEFERLMRVESREAKVLAFAV